MASLSRVARLSPVDFGSKSPDTDMNDNSDVLNNSLDIMTGAQLSDFRTFKSRNGRNVTVTPVIVDLRRLLQTTSLDRSFDIIPGIPNQDLVHAVVAMYDVALPEMTPDILYSTVCEKWARTLILVRDISDCLAELNESKKEAWSEETKNDAKEPQVTPVNVPEGDGDVYKSEDSTPCTFADVFSNPATDEEDSDEDEEDFSKGIFKFIKTVQDRKLKRKIHQGPFTAEDIGVEDRLVACATFEKKYCKPGEKVIHLTVIATRNRYRKMGIGKYLLQQIKDPLVVGHYDVIVVHADNSAVEFFENYGFMDDVVLNSRWMEFAEQFTNCTLMSYLPPFTGQTLLGSSHSNVDILTMEREIKQWEDKSLQAYQSQKTLITRLRHEVIHLQALVAAQHGLIGNLSAENEKLQHEKFLVEKEFLEYRLSNTKSAFQFGEDNEDEADGDASISELNTQYLISRLEKQLNLKTCSPQYNSEVKNSIASTDDGHMYYVSPTGDSSEPYDHTKDMAEFYQITKDFKDSPKNNQTLNPQLEVSMLTKAVLKPSIQERFQVRKQQLHDPMTSMRLYYCGSLEHPDRIQEILKNGFSEADFSHSEYGRGLYFSNNVSTAVQFSTPGKLILAQVAVGTMETVTKKDIGKCAPSHQFDSAVTTGRLIPSGGDDVLYQEYVVYDINQALPLYLIEYVTSA